MKPTRRAARRRSSRFMGGFPASPVFSIARVLVLMCGRVSLPICLAHRVAASSLGQKRGNGVGVLENQLKE